MNELAKTEQASRADWEVVEEQLFTEQLRQQIRELFSMGRPIDPHEMAHGFIVRNSEVPVEGVQFYLETQGLNQTWAKQVAERVFERFLILR